MNLKPYSIFFVNTVDMQDSVEKSAALTFDFLTNANDHVLMKVRVSNHEEILDFELSSDKPTLVSFAKRLQQFPSDLNDSISVEWQDGSVISDTGTDCGNIRAMVKTIGITGRVIVRFELLNPRKFRAGMKLYNESKAIEPVALNRFGKSLEGRLSNPSGNLSLET